MAYNNNLVHITVDIDADTRVLMQFDPNDDAAPVELFNDDDLCPIGAPPIGSQAREILLLELRQWWLDNGLDTVEVPMPVLQ